jgi:hemolysin activation/secretion protein
VLSAEEISTATAPYTGRAVSQEDLEALRLALTLLYVDKGYINSGLILPDQTIRDGVVTYQAVEGRLTGIEVEGSRWFRSGYLERRLALGAGPPLNANALQERFQLLLEDERIRRLNGELSPGLRPGEAVLKVRVEESAPYRAFAEVNNHQSPSVGAERVVVSGEHQNLSGNGDLLRLQYGRSEGLDPLLDLKYTLPITARDTTLSLQYRKNTFAVVEEPFNQLDIRSKSEIYGISLRHPLYRTLRTELAVEGIAEKLSNRTFLLGQPFTLSPGAEGGESVVSALRFAQEAIHRTAEHLVAARSRFSVGVDALGATVNSAPDAPSGKFFAWLGQFQWVRRLPFRDGQAILRADTQLAESRLLVLEQFAVGGRYTVRGYRENTLVRDNALVLSLEGRFPVVRRTSPADYLELASFVDYGRGWNKHEGNRTSLSSAGVGLRWGAAISPRVRTQLELYWAHPFRDIPSPEDDLQDKGVHFQFVLGVL